MNIRLGTSANASIGFVMRLAVVFGAIPYIMRIDQIVGRGPHRFHTKKFGKPHFRV